MEIKNLKRSLKLLGALLLTLSATTPASSVFIIAPGVVQQAGTGAFLSFALAALISLSSAYVYAELSSAFPLTGGEYAIVGRVLGPFAGFVVLGLNIITMIFIAAVLPLGIGNYIGFLFPGTSSVTLALWVVVLSTVCGILHIRTNAVITGIFLSGEVLALVVVSVLGFGHITRPLSDLMFHPVTLGLAGQLQPASIGMIGLATSVAVFAYNGYGNAVYFGEETYDAPRSIARAILWALVIAVIAEAVPVTAMLMGAPDLKALFGSQNMLGDFIADRGGKTLGMIISLGIAFAIFNANLAYVLMIARQFYSTGRDRVWPPVVNRVLTHIYNRFHSPVFSTLLCGVLAGAACFISMTMLLVITGTGIVVIYVLLNVAAVEGRRKGITAHGPYKMPLYPFWPIVGFVAMAYVLYANFLDEAVGRPSLWATLGIIVLSAAYYFLILRRRGRWELRGPSADMPE
jgi:amino acid transporter